MGVIKKKKIKFNIEALSEVSIREELIVTPLIYSP